MHEAYGSVILATLGRDTSWPRSSFKDAIEVEKNCSRCRNNYAAFLFVPGALCGGREAIDYVVQDTLFAVEAQGICLSRLCRLRLFDPEGAEEAFSTALSMDRTNTIALLELARIRYEAEDYVTAIQFYDTFRSVSRSGSQRRGCWLGIRLAQADGDRDAEASYALSLG